MWSGSPFSVPLPDGRIDFAYSVDADAETQSTRSDASDLIKLMESDSADGDPEISPVGSAQGALAGTEFTMRVPVLMYHRITCAPPDAQHPSLWICPEKFRAHLVRLKAEGWTSVTADALARTFEARERFGRKYFVISIDDGNRDGYTAAFPILQELGMVATFYVPAGRVGCCRRQLSWDDVRTMHAAGQDIGNHGMDHDALAGASDLFWEIEMSQRVFDRELGYRPTTFCYPYGSHDAQAHDQVRRSGMILAFTTAYGARESTKAPMASKRIRINRSDSAAEVLAKVSEYASGE